MRKSKAKQYVNKNPLEQLLDIGSGVAQAGADFGKKAVNLDNWDEILGMVDPKEKQKNQHAGGDLSEGKILDLRKIHKKDQAEAKAESDSARTEKEPGIDYVREIIHAGERVATRENREIEGQLKEIMSEIKKLADSSKELQTQFKEVAVEQHVEKPGKYHKNFFEWLLSVVRIARMKVENSGAWLAAMQSKKKSRQYGEMSKKHGTTFTLSHERTAATQTG
ncbi:MAG: DUF5660 domain-containing protein [Candidatus Levybacteria bacterium]|nr:DUF5660 domain-containing protein [Candidatus Levybacteria bacterium]